MISAFFGGKIGEGKATVGLNDADGGEVGKVEAFGDGLGADDNIEVAGFNFAVEGVKGVGFGVIGVEAGDAGGLKKFIQFRFKKFGTEPLVDDFGVAAVRAADGDFGLITTSVTEEGIGVGVEA